MTDPGERRKAIWICSISGLALLVLLYWMQPVFLPLFLALGLAYILDPVVRRVMAFGLSRGWSVTLVFLIFLASSGGALWYAVDQGIQLVQLAFQDSEGGKGFLTKAVEGVQAGIERNWASLGEITGNLEQRVQKSEYLPRLGEQLQGIIAGLAGWIGSLVNVVSFLVLVPIYLFYLLLDYPRILLWTREHLPARQRGRLLGLAETIHCGLAAFLRGRVIIALLKGLLTALGLLISGLPYAFVLGMLSGILSIIPFIGATLGFLVAMILVFAELSATTGPLIGVILTYTLVEVVEGYLFFPWILGNRIQMHPVTMLFSFLFWGALLGFFGVLLAVPLTIVVKATLVEYILPPLETLASREDPG